MNNQLENRKEVFKMNATRATATITTDGATFGITTETPPEDPPPDRFAVRSKQCAV